MDGWVIEWMDEQMEKQTDKRGDTCCSQWSHEDELSLFFLAARFWESLRLPCNISLSALEANQREREADTVQALQALSMAGSHQVDTR